MIDPKNIQLTENELNKCLEFSEISAQNQQKIEFGQKTTSPRKVSEIARDNLIGKIAEVAFCKLLKENYGIDIELDFNYYPRGQWDSQDAEVNGWRIDIKGTRKGGHWLLIEWNKLNFRQRDNNLSHVFVMFSVDWNRNIDAPTGKASPISSCDCSQSTIFGYMTIGFCKNATSDWATQSHLTCSTRQSIQAA